MRDFVSPAFPRLKDISPKEMFRAAGKALSITIGVVSILALTIVWAVASVITKVIISMVEQFTQPGPPKRRPAYG